MISNTPTTEPEDSKVWDAVIAKWQLLAYTPTTEVPNCALCELYNRSSMINNRNCIGCPVNAFTGRRWCERTPYQSWWLAHLGQPRQCFAHLKQETAEAELLFLEGLRYLDETGQLEKYKWVE